MRGMLLLVLMTACWCGGEGARGQEADPRRPAAVEASGAPAVPAALWRRLGEYQNVRAAAFAGWAPSGRGIVIQTRFGATAQVHRVYEPGGRREQQTFFEEPASGRFIPGQPDDLLLLSMGAGGNENYQLHLFGPRKEQRLMLTDGKSRNTLGPIRRDGSRMIVHSNRRNGRDTDLYLSDCRGGSPAELLLETKNEYWNASDWSPDGKTLALNRFVSVTETYPALFDIATRKLTPLPIPGGGKAAFGRLAFSADGRSLFLASDAWGEFQELARLDLETLKYERLSQDIPWDVSDIEVDSKTGVVAFTINEDGASRVFLWNQGKRRALDLPLGIVSSLEFSPDGRQLGFTLSRPDSPADAYSLSLADGRLTRWTFSETGGLDAQQFVTPTRIQFASFDGRKIPAYYYRPRGAAPEKKAPVLINIHGGPEGQSRPLFSGITQFQVTELGLAVIYPNVRGSLGYGKTYTALDNAARREDSVRDIGALLDWIAQQPELDASRVAVTGGSYGGYMVLASLTHFPERIKAGIDIVGIANFITFLEKTSPYRQDLRRAEYGDERDPAMRAVFEKISPTVNVGKIRSALLVAHGRNDPRVPFGEAQQIAEKVRAAGRPVWTVYAANEGHGFEKKENRDYAQAVEVLFLSQHLGLTAIDGGEKRASP